MCSLLLNGLFYEAIFVILFLRFSVLLAMRLSRMGKRELTLVLFVRLFDLSSFGFVCFLFLLVSGKLWLVMVALPGFFSISGHCMYLHVCRGEIFISDTRLAIFWGENCSIGFLHVGFLVWCRCFKCILLSLWMEGVR